MPHSSGGGHGGGSHRSSSHSSRRSSHSSHHHSSGGGSRSGGCRNADSYAKPAASVSRKPFSGARRYSYYRRGRLRHIYSNADPQTLFRPSKLVFAAFFLPFLILAVIFIYQPIRSMMRKTDQTILIADDANVLGDTGGLMTALEDFRAKSKVVPAVMTVSNAQWQPHFASLEEYAYSQYVQTFRDEKHWLIVYSKPDASAPSAGSEQPADDQHYADSWYWEGMQGDDTDHVLTGQVTYAFNRKLQEGLEANERSVTENLTAAFEQATVQIKPVSAFYKLRETIPGWILLMFILPLAYFALGLDKLKLMHAELDPDPATDPVLQAEAARAQIPAMNSVPDEMPALTVPAQPQQMQQPPAMPPGVDPQQHAFFAQQRAFEAQQQALRMPKNDPDAGTICTVCGMRCMAGVRYCPSCGTELTQL